jgi:hypothetical protein
MKVDYDARTDTLTIVLADVPVAESDERRFELVRTLILARGQRQDVSPRGPLRHRVRQLRLALGHELAKALVDRSVEGRRHVGVEHALRCLEASRL